MISSTYKVCADASLHRDIACKDRSLQGTLYAIFIISQSENSKVSSLDARNSSYESAIFYATSYLH